MAEGGPVERLVRHLCQRRALTPNRLHALLLRYQKRSLSFLVRGTHTMTRDRFKGEVCVHKLVRVKGYYRGSYFCYNVQGDGHRLGQCQLSTRAVLTYYQRKCRLKFHAFILRKKRSGCVGSSEMARIIATVQARFPSITVALSLNRHPALSCGHFFRTNTGHCLLHRRARGRTRCHHLRPRSVSLSGHLHYLGSLGHVKFRAKANVVIKDPKRAISRLMRSVLFVRRFHPRVVNVNPFLPRRSAPFTSYPPNDLARALALLSVFQLVRPRTLVPSAATLTDLAPSKHRGNVLTNTGMIVPGLSPMRRQGGCTLCSGGTSVNSRTTRKLHLLTRQLTTVNCRVSGDQKSCPNGALWVALRLYAELVLGERGGLSTAGGFSVP